MLEAVEAHPRAVERVDPGDRYLRVVVGRLHAEFVRLIDGCPDHFGRGAEELDAIRAELPHGPDPGPGSARRRHGLGHGGKGLDARSRDFSLLAAPLEVQRPLQSHDGTDIAHGRDAMRQPELEHVLGIGHHATADGVSGRARVHVCIDEPGQDEEALGLQEPRGRRGIDAGADGRDPAVGDEEIALEDAAPRVHGDQGAAADQEMAMGAGCGHGRR